MKKVLIGCAVAGGLVILLVVGIGFWLKGQMQDMSQIDDLQKEMVARHGAAEDFTPPLDGSLAVDRVALFVQLREELNRERQAISSDAEEMIQHVKTQEGKDRNFFQKIFDTIDASRRGFAILKNGLAFLVMREQKLLEAGMGDGEYSFLYSLMAFSWLEWDPLAKIGEETFEEYDMETTADQLRAEYRKIFLTQLKNHRRALQDKPSLSPSEQEALTRVDAVIEQARVNRGQFPYQGRLPKSWVDTLEPYRYRFESTLPSTPIDFLVEAIAVLEDEDKDGVNIQIGN